MLWVGGCSPGNALPLGLGLCELPCLGNKGGVGKQPRTDVAEDAKGNLLPHCTLA